MSTEYSYDEEGQFFPYFITSVLGLVLVPLTYSTFRSSKDPSASKAPLIKSNEYKPPKIDAVEAARRRQAKRERRLKRFTTITIGWALFAYMCYLIKTTEVTGPKLWNPYEILGISTSLDEKAIKRTFKKLSVKFHPDKIKPGPDETLEELNDRFVEITKAYKALTDEEVRNNYIQYGHPDGKQSFSIGIALPKWIVSEGNSYYVLAVYGLLFGILLPYTVGKWWYGTRRLTKDGVLVESAGKIFKEYDEEMTLRKLVKVITAGEEMKEIVSGAHESDWSNGQEATVEKALAQAGLPAPQMKELSDLDGWRRRAVGLLWAHLYRVDTGDKKLENAKLEIAAAAVVLNKSFHSMALTFGNLHPLLASIRLTQHVIQAVAPGESPLLQIPFFTERIVDRIESDGGKNHWNVQRFMSLPEEQRKKLCVGQGLLTDYKYQTAMTFARTLPSIHVEAAFFKVSGEKFITPQSLVQFVLKLRVVPPGWTPPAVSQKELIDEDEDEEDVDALIGRKGDRDELSKQFPLAHSPYYPRDHHQKWYVFLADQRQHKVVVPPDAITSFDKPTDNFTVVTTRIKFQAPPQPGQYTFTMCACTDSYLGLDVSQEVTLDVSDPSKVERIEEVDDISEPDEDSIAGQMSAMRGGQVKKAKKVVDDTDEDEDDSDTDGAPEEMSETDTETEDES